MDKSRDPCKLTDVVMEAYNRLSKLSIVEITKPIDTTQSNEAPGWEFECDVEIPYPNREGLPEKIGLRLFVPESFPREPVDVFALTEEARGFPHQDVETGKLCLYDEHEAPLDVSRLVCYTEWAIAWLEDAANGRLLPPGAPYELPDFRHDALHSSLPLLSRVIFQESPATYSQWEGFIGKYGTVECYLGRAGRTIYVTKFLDASGSTIREAEFSKGILNEHAKVNARWILLNDIRYNRHRPPKTYAELHELCSKCGIDVFKTLKRAWKAGDPCNFGVLLFGFPIPEVVDGPLTEVHWQPLLFKTRKQDRQDSRSSAGSNVNKHQSHNSDRIWRGLIKSGSFSASQQLLWGRAENVTRERLYKRGAYTSRVQSISAACFGCGALGSSVAELLARGGVNQLSLFDADSVEFGNLCRHTLDGSALGFNKAVTLADKLSRTCPLSTINGYAERVPLHSRSDDSAQQAIADADFFLDCTTSESAFDWLNHLAFGNDKRLASLFFNLHAQMLTICISGDSTSCADVYTDMCDCIKHDKTPIDPDVYFDRSSNNEQMYVGAGCWHPTFPGRFADIQVLAAYAVDILIEAIDSLPASGLAAIVQRNSVGCNGIQPGALVELLWEKKY